MLEINSRQLDDIFGGNSTQRTYSDSLCNAVGSVVNVVTTTAVTTACIATSAANKRSPGMCAGAGAGAGAYAGAQVTDSCKSATSSTPVDDSRHSSEMGSV